MAIASSSPPYPLLFDYLLASSWTWFAICLATVATSLRALRIFLLRHRLVSPLTAAQPPSSLPPIPSSLIDAPLLFSSLTHPPSPPSISSDNSFQRRARSKSTSALEKLHRNGEGFLHSGMEFLSSVLDANLSPSLKKITSASKLFHDDSSCEKTQQKPGNYAFSTATVKRRAQTHNLTDDLGFISETLVHDNEDSCNTCFKDDQPHIHDDVPSWLPSWAYSLCDPLQTTLSFPSASTYGKDEDSNTSTSVEGPPCFEKQFGWDRLLESRFGSPWNSLAWFSRFAEDSSNVVKMWPGQQKKLVKALDPDAIALDVWSQKGVACTGNIAGEISLWELGRKAYSKASVSFAQPIVALSVNCEQGATLVGSGKGLGLWDQRSPICMPLAMSAENVTLSALKSKGSDLCIANSESTLSMYDLRKLHGKPLYRGPVTKRALVSSDSDDEADSNLLEKLTCDDEEDFWDEGSVTSIGNGVELQKGCSFLSNFASIMRVLSTSM